MRVSAATIALALLAVAFLVAGSLTWRMTAANCHRMVNGRGVVCSGVNMPGPGVFLVAVGRSPRHRAHPRRAELLWGAGGVAALAAVVVEIRRRRPTG